MIYQNNLGFSNQLLRLIWSIVWFLFARPLPRSIGNRWKILLLKLFGAKVHFSSVIYSSAIVYQPWKLVMGLNSCLADEVICYNVDFVYIEDNVTVSQKSYLCTASHDVSVAEHTLVTAPIKIERNAWIAADSFIGMGVTVGTGAVVGARSSVFKSVDPWIIVGGNPARFIKKRVII